MKRRTGLIAMAVLVLAAILLATPAVALPVPAGLTAEQAEMWNKLTPEQQQDILDEAEAQAAESKAGLKDVSIETSGGVTTVHTGDGRTITMKTDPVSLNAMIVGFLSPSGNMWFDAFKYAVFLSAILQVVYLVVKIYLGIGRAREEARERRWRRER